MQGAEREQKIELIRKMLNADRQIRDLTMPWMAQLSKLINSTGTERRVVNAYGSVTSSVVTPVRRCKSRSTAVGMPENTVGPTLTRARRKLRERGADTATS